MSESAIAHKKQAPVKLNFAIITVSTSRYDQHKKGDPAPDVSGDLAERLVKKNRHAVAQRQLIPDDNILLKKSFNKILATRRVDVAVFCGGTGIAASDVTIETLNPLLQKTLPGFGEVFRRLSYDKIGSAAILSRAAAGIAKGKAFFCIPGSPEAVELCMEKLILPEAPHIVKHARE